jgi:hypothetical protein
MMTRERVAMLSCVETIALPARCDMKRVRIDTKVWAHDSSSTFKISTFVYLPFSDLCFDVFFLSACADIVTRRDQSELFARPILTILYPKYRNRLSKSILFSERFGVTRRIELETTLYDQIPARISFQTTGSER